jgi:hypothetical protein
MSTVNLVNYLPVNKLLETQEDIDPMIVRKLLVHYDSCAQFLRNTKTAKKHSPLNSMKWLGIKIKEKANELKRLKTDDLRIRLEVAKAEFERPVERPVDGEDSRATTSNSTKKKNIVRLSNVLWFSAEFAGYMVVLCTDGQLTPDIASRQGILTNSMKFGAFLLGMAQTIRPIFKDMGLPSYGSLAYIPRH